MLDRADGTMLDPIDVVWDVLGVEASVMMLNVVMVIEVTNDAGAEEMRPLVISPVGVGIVAEEMSIMLLVESGDELLRLAELQHAVIVLVHVVRMLVEEGAILHVLVVKDGGVHSGSGGSKSCCHGKSNGKLHF